MVVSNFERGSVFTLPGLEDIQYVVISNNTINAGGNIIVVPLSTHDMKRPCSTKVTMLNGQTMYATVSGISNTMTANLSRAIIIGALYSSDVDKISRMVYECVISDAHHTESTPEVEPIEEVSMESNVSNESPTVSTDIHQDILPYVRRPRWSQHANIIKLKQDCWTYSADEVIRRIRYCHPDGSIDNAIRQKFHRFLANTVHRYNISNPPYHIRIYKKTRLMIRLTDEQVVEFRNDINTLSMPELSTKYGACENELNEMKQYYLESPHR